MVSPKQLIEKFDLRSRLRFKPEEAQIWLGESRMLLQHARAQGAMRKELFDLLGPRRAKGVLLRAGFAAGQADGDLALKLLGEDENFEVFKIGPILHGFEGLVKARILNSSIDWQDGRFEGEVELTGSWEAEAHRQFMGLSDDMACWTIVGYASGYTSRFFKRFIVFKEQSCACSGAETCLMVGKPAEAWGDDDYISYFRSEHIDEKRLEVEAELTSLRGAPRRQEQGGRLVGNSPAFRRAFELLSTAANSPINVLLLGETGVGKDTLARAMHDESERRLRPFVAVNCAAIPESLLASELFGYM
ncbi:MAG: XylR N-terminal domain-containing protein, partial [Gammaproteobacteria bacterium]|nr:XylR N-terminal domain-containing protein [Gammaproteobacteria bacterium]